MKVENAQNVIDQLIDLIEIKQSKLREAKNYGVDSQFGYSEITNAVTEIATAATALKNYTEMIARADFSETPIG